MSNKPGKLDDFLDKIRTPNLSALYRHLLPDHTRFLRLISQDVSDLKHQEKRCTVTNIQSFTSLKMTLSGEGQLLLLLYSQSRTIPAIK